MSRHEFVALVGAAVVAVACGAAVVDTDFPSPAPCAPVPRADIVLYDDWGATLDPPRVWHSCAEQCVDGLRLCLFLAQGEADNRVLAVCNGRDHGPPCQLPGVGP